MFQLGLLDLGDSTVPLPPEITLIDTPSETKGHRVVRIVSGGEVLYFLSDLFHVTAKINNPYLCPTWADRTALTESRHRIITAIRRDNAHFLCSHMQTVISADSFIAVK